MTWLALIDNRLIDALQFRPDRSILSFSLPNQATDDSVQALEFTLVCGLRGVE
jgi:hypothetical protein